MKKIIAIILALCFILSTMSACGNNNAESANSAMSNAETMNSATTDDELPTPDAASSESVYEETVDSASENMEVIEASAVEEASTQVQHTTIQMPLTEEPITFTLFMSGNPQAQNYFQDMSQNIFYSKLEELSGVHIEFSLIHPKNFDTYFELQMASGDYCDIYSENACAYSGGFDAAIEDEVYIDLTDMLEEYAPNYYALIHSSEDNLRYAYTDAGRIVRFDLYYEGGQRCDTGPMIRADWAAEIGLEPMDIDTYAEYEEYIEYAYETYGATIQLGNTGAPPHGYLTSGYGTLTSFGTSDRANFPLLQIDGQAVCGGATDGFKEYIEMISRWYANGWVYSDFYSLMTGAQGGADFGMVTSGESSMWWAEATNLATYTAESLNVAAIPDAAKNEGDQTHLSQVDPGNLSNMCNFVITTACEYPEIAMQWIDFRYSEEGALMANWGIEGETFNYDDDGNPTYTDLIVNNADGMTANVARYCYLMAIDNDPHLIDPNVSLQGLNEMQVEAPEIWLTNKDNSYYFPDAVTMTADEQSEYNTYYSDITTYARENMLKIITGDESVETLDEFVDTLYSLGLEEAMELQQAALDRYYQRGA